MKGVMHAQLGAVLVVRIGVVALRGAACRLGCKGCCQVVNKVVATAVARDVAKAIAIPLPRIVLRSLLL